MENRPNKVTNIFEDSLKNILHLFTAGASSPSQIQQNPKTPMKYKFEAFNNKEGSNDPGKLKLVMEHMAFIS